MRVPSIICILSIALTGCATSRQVKFPPNPVMVGDFVQQIKHEIGLFQLRKKALPTYATKCGAALDVAAKKVGISVSVALKKTSDGSVSIELPLGTGSIGAAASANRTLSGTQTIAFSVYPESLSDANQLAPASPKFEGTPVTDALMAVYDGLRTNSAYEPCLTFGVPADQKNVVTYGFKVENSRTLGGKVKIFVFALGASQKEEHSNENTITVDFKLSGSAVTIN